MIQAEHVSNLKKAFLFEVSWEVCNRVGGIYTVLRTKLHEAIKQFGGNYVLIGPLLDDNRSFIEDDSGLYGKIAFKLKEKGINCKVGYWDTAGTPTVVLVDFKNRYTLDSLLYNLWTDYKVDSLASNYDYQEPILFATAAAEVIEILSRDILVDGFEIIAAFHEWLCGAGLLYLKKHCCEIATVFTTHATVLGRALSSKGVSIYNLDKNFDPTLEAKKNGVFSKHSLEVAAAREAHCFTTVSSITADEAYLMLEKYPDKIIYNGLDVEKKQVASNQEFLGEIKIKLRKIASKTIGISLPENTLLWMSSGRYEFHNKGYDVILKSLAKLESRLPKDSPPIVVFLLIAANWHTKQDSLLEGDWTNNLEQKSSLGLATHQLHHPDGDSIVRLCKELNLQHSERKIHVVFSDAYLNGSDGVFDVVYEQLLAAFDLGIFPSFYEPWGYTPLECVAESVPTVTTDLAGFGYWVNSLATDHQDAVYVLERRNKDDGEFTDILTDCLEKVAKISANQQQIEVGRKKAFAIAELADWTCFYQEYLKAYCQALKFNAICYNKVEAVTLDTKNITTIYDAETLTPRFRNFRFESTLPEKINDLRELAYNFWWSWNEDAKALFQKINPELWESVKHNPAYFLNQVSGALLQKAASSESYLRLYKKTIAAFLDSRQENKAVIRFCSTTSIDEQHPLVYFCMEYGIDECLPIYSGGLGILAGDYLKVMSDLRVPMVAVGLFYKQGYFLQSINAKGEQIALYKTWNSNQIPMHPMRDEHGKIILVGVQILGRAVFAKIWEAKVGYTKLYLLDTDVNENEPEDREITNSLYGGNREVRLKQEIVLGIGGIRFILEKLKITPSLYHLNEGHSAFLLLERLRNYHHQGIAWEEAIELVRASSIFTTHTPVPAGNEEFAEELIRKYFDGYAEPLGISLEKLLALARSGEPEASNGGSENLRTFSMTALSLRLCSHSNAVSTLHGKVARGMWQSIWPELLEDEVPITHVTNGVHLGTWLGASMKLLYDDYLGSKWEKHQDDKNVWKEVLSIPDKEVWKTHQLQKEALLNLVKKMVLKQYSIRNESKQLINVSLNCLNSETLLLGLARRFTSYKRNDLVLKDRERLARILTNSEKPVVMLVAGKAHPADSSGGELIHDIIETIRDIRFNGHIIFLEEYNIALAKALVQGIDVWINTPILGREACGTSGMKVGVNGGLNFSTKDGWWEEAYDYSLGWEIESMPAIEDLEKRNDVESMFLLNTLESDIVPLYYNKQRAGFNPEWVNKMKASIALTACEYSTYRMAKDYINNLYCPTILQTERLLADNSKQLKEIVTWKNEINERFNTVKIKAIFLDGIKEGKIVSQGMVGVRLLLFKGKLKTEEIKVELVLIKTDGKKFIDSPIIIPLRLTDAEDVDVLRYEGEYKIEDTGYYSYGIRVYPCSDKLLRQQDAGIVYWG